MSDAALSSLSFQRQPSLDTPPESPLKFLRFTQESLKGTPETATSQQVTSRRGTSDVIPVGRTVAGTISFELSYKDFRHWTEAALMGTIVPININQTVSFDAVTSKISCAADVFADVQTGCSLKIKGLTIPAENQGIKRVIAKGETAGVYWLQFAQGSIGTTAANVANVTLEGSHVVNGRDMHYYTLERSLKGADGADYFHSFSSCVVDGLELNFESQKIVTGTLSIIGTSSGESEETSSLGDLVPAETDGVFGSNLHVGTILADGETMADKMKSLKLSLKNGCTPNDCVGQMGAFEVSLGDLSLELDANFYFANNSNIISLNNSLARSIYLEIGGEAGRICIHIPRFKFTDGNAPIPGKTGSVMQPMKAIALDSEEYGGSIFVSFIAP